MTKIIAINGSYRGNKGFTSFCLGKIFEGARMKGAECEEIRLAEKMINHCTGCQVCHTPQHYLHCIYEGKDDVQAIITRIKEADIIIFATPVYIFTMSGLLKSFLERLNSTCDSNQFAISKSGLFFHQIDPVICSKPFVTFVCCDNLEDDSTRNVVDYFKTFSKFMDARQVGVLVRKTAGIFERQRAAGKESRFPGILEVNQALIEAGKELASSGKISSSTQKRVNQNIVPVPPAIKLLMNIAPVKQKIIEKVRIINS
jgi:multimeric flavodoxin WrbA